MKTLLFILLVLPLALFGQDNQVTGIVTNYLTGLPMADCHVYLTEDYGVVTNEDGSFQLDVPPAYSENTLSISHIGYQTYEMPVSDMMGASHDITLLGTAILLPADMVVVVPDLWDDFRYSVMDLIESTEDQAELTNLIRTELSAFGLEIGNATGDDRNDGPTLAQVSVWTPLSVLLILSVLIAFRKRIFIGEEKWNGVG